MSVILPHLGASTLSSIRQTTSKARSQHFYSPSTGLGTPHSAFFSTQPARLNTTRDSKSQRPSSNNSEVPEYPAFSLSGLGASRAVKITVYTALGVMGTLETIFWTKTIWNYFSPSKESLENETSP